MEFGCKGLTFTYPGIKNPVFEDLEFSMTAPGFNAVFGPSGVGKTSFARLLSGAASQSNGIPGQPFHLKGIKTILYSYNQERLPGWSSTGSHLDKVCPPGKEGLKQELVEIFEVGEVLGSRFSQLSMGQQNRMNLIRYLIQEFDLLIMDESLANVDESLRQTILLAIKDLFPDKLFLYISHNLMEVAMFCREILVLGRSSGDQGDLVVQGLDTAQKGKEDRPALERVMLEIMNAV